MIAVAVVFTTEVATRKLLLLLLLVMMLLLPLLLLLLFLPLKMFAGSGKYQSDDQFFK